MKVVAFVPIKLNNQRFPGKNLKCFSDGKPLLTMFLETLSKIKEIDESYVFCSSREVEQYLVGDVRFLQRPSSLDSKDAKPQDIISAFMKLIDADVYGMCHCTSPFVAPKHFEECIHAVKTEAYDSAFTAERLQRLLWTDRFEPLNFAPDNIPRTQDLPPIYAEVSAAYFFRREVFEKYQRRIGSHPYIAEVNGMESMDIDYQEDFEMANILYTAMSGGVLR